jgi:hypothetical protein
MPDFGQKKHRKRRDGKPFLSLASVSHCAALAGCSATPAEPASLGHAKKITLYEGLPHQFYEPRALLAEKKTKSTTELGGFTFYSETLDRRAAGDGSRHASAVRFLGRTACRRAGTCHVGRSQRPPPQ